MLTRLLALLKSAAARVDWYLALLLGLSVLALTPLTAPGYFYEAHDGRHSVFYLQMFDASFRSGALWPRWAMHHIQGYGYPTFMIQAPLGFYLGELFVLAGAGLTLAVRLTWVTGFLAGAWGLYRLVLTWLQEPESQSACNDPPLPTPPRRREGNHNPSPDVGGGREGVETQVGNRLDPARLCAVVAGLLYVFIPYHLVDIYVRAALNDTLLLAWFPWVFLAFDRLIILGGAAGWTRRLALATLLLGGTLLTHTFALISFAPLLVTFVLFLLLYGVRHVSSRPGPLLGRMILSGFAGVAALLLMAIFLVPLFLEAQRDLDQQVYVTNTYDFRRHFVQIGQYFSPFWGFGYSDDPTGASDGMGFQVGLLPLLLGFCALMLPWRQPRLRWLAVYLGGATVALLFLMSPWALPLWEAVPALSVIQFPWRLLALVALLVSALGGLTLYQLVTQGVYRKVETDLSGFQKPDRSRASNLPYTHTEVSEAATAGLLVVALLVIFGSYSYVDARLQPVEPWREDGRAVYQFEREHPDMIAYTTWVQKKPFTESPMSQDYASPDYAESHGYTTSLRRLAITRGVGDILQQYSNGSRFGGVVRMARPGTVRVHLYYFPGWQVTVDGLPAFYRVSEPYGLLEIDLTAGEHRIDVRMGWTPVRLLGAGVSGAVLFVVLLLLLWPLPRVVRPGSF